MTAIEHRNKAEFIQEAVFYIGVFAASTIVAVVSRFTEERLGLLWREFLTRNATNMYLDEGTYYRLQTAEDWRTRTSALRRMSVHSLLPRCLSFS